MFKIIDSDRNDVKVGTEYETSDEAARAIIDEDLYDTKDFDDSLDEECGFVKVCGLEYASSYVLKEVDPTAYRTMFLDWVDNLMSEDIWELGKKLDMMYDGDEIKEDGVTIACVEPDDEEGEEDENA